MRELGCRIWAQSGGRVPLRSSGPKPEFTSRDEIVVLNTCEVEARIEIDILYADRNPVGPYALTVKARRIRRIRFNDLIFPEAMPLDTEYGAVIRSDRRIVVQFSRTDTGARAG
ncbi:sensory rhodopsin transducer [Faunimonas sp. B44]|uniref:sensory rhodopsin transducer n=1 Tax=Faunimonas sp. B44 TaxID=3461493 RepID=UPI00404465B5